MVQHASTAPREVAVTAGGVGLPGMLAMPAGAVGAVIFAHGSGSSRLSPRNVRVAEHLHDARLAAALWAAAADPHVRAVVSRGGRPDLERERPGDVRAPTLLIVGSFDPVVLDLNEQARLAMRCERELRLVPGATHLFEEPGALETVARLARDWFLEHLRE